MTLQICVFSEDHSSKTLEAYATSGTAYPTGQNVCPGGSAYFRIQLKPTPTTNPGDF